MALTPAGGRSHTRPEGPSGRPAGCGPWGDTMTTFPLRVGVALLAAVALGPVTAAPIAAGPVENAIGTPVVTCTTYDGHPAFAFSVPFTHRPPALELRVYQFAGTEPIGSDHAWYRSPGSDTFSATFDAAVESTFVVHLWKLDNRDKTFADVVPPVTTQAYRCD